MRTHLAGAMALAMTMAIAAPAFAGTDPHKPAKAAAAKPAAHPAPTPAAHAAPKPAAPHASPHAAAAAPPAVPKQAPNSLVEVHDRIQARVAEVAAKWKKAPAPAARQTPAAAPPRIRVVWRAAVSWPAALSGDVTEVPPAHAGDRIPVSWTASPDAAPTEAPPK